MRRWRDGTTAPVFAWFCVLAGSSSAAAPSSPGCSRGRRVPPVPAEPTSAPRLVRVRLEPHRRRRHASRTRRAGRASPAVAPFTLFRMGLLQTLLTVGLLVVGVAGMWKFATMFPSTGPASRAFIVYAATPLIGGAMAVGRLTVLVVYAADTVDHPPAAAGGRSRNGRSRRRRARSDRWRGPHHRAERGRRVVVAGLVVALAAAFAPIAVPLAIVIAVCLALGTLLALASWRVAGWFAICGIGAALVGAVLNAAVGRRRGRGPNSPGRHRSVRPGADCWRWHRSRSGRRTSRCSPSRCSSPWSWRSPWSRRGA